MDCGCGCYLFLRYVGAKIQSGERLFSAIARPNYSLFQLLGSGYL
jgi:hypothetical protein